MFVTCNNSLLVTTNQRAIAETLIMVKKQNTVDIKQIKSRLYWNKLRAVCVIR